MSDQHDKAPGASDEIDYFKVIAVGVVSLAIFAIATWWAATIMRREITRVHASEHTVGAVAAAAKPVEIGRSEIGIVDQVPFTADRRLDGWRTERAERLHGYGWVDRDKKIIHIPIERAMEQVAAGALPAGAPQ